MFAYNLFLLFLLLLFDIIYSYSSPYSYNWKAHVLLFVHPHRMYRYLIISKASAETAQSAFCI